jgi:hypothetical protein
MDMQPMILVPKGKGKGKAKRKNKRNGRKKVMMVMEPSLGKLEQQYSSMAVASGQKARARSLEIRERELRVKSLTQQLSPYDHAWIKQIMLPEACRGGSAMLSPAPTPARAQAAHFRLEHVITGVQDDTTVCVKPTLHPVSVTTQAPVTSGYFNIEGAVSPDGSMQGEYYDFDEGSGGVTTLEFVGYTSQFQGKSAMIVSAPAASVITFTPKGWPNGSFTVSFYDSVADTWDNMGLFDTTTTNSTPFTVGANAISAIAVEGDAGTFLPGYINQAGVSITAPQLFTFSGTLIHEPVEIDLPDDAERYRITALSVKVTFFGSTLNNQGEAAVARTYPGWTPYGGGSAWDNIASLPFNSYDGRVENGVHCFWLPTDMDELDFRNNFSEFSSLDYTRIWIALKGLDSTASVRVELDAIVEFYSPDPLFSKDPCPYLKDKYGEILYYLGLANPSGDNPGHLARIAGIGKKVAKAAETGASTIAKVAGTAAMFI